MHGLPAHIAYIDYVHDALVDHRGSFTFGAVISCFNLSLLHVLLLGLRTQGYLAMVK